MNGKSTGNLVYLSHYLDTDTPMYANEGQVTRVPLKCLDHGDTANLERWSLNSHSGTHIDMPAHFLSDGNRLENYPPEYFMAENICWIDLSENCRPGKIIGIEDLQAFSPAPATEVLLLKTGNERYRGSQTYWKENPGFADTLADYLRRTLPALRFFGFDSLSLTSYQDRALGKAAHRAFLGTQRPILLIEDMKLSDLDSGCKINKISIVPLLFSRAEGSPVTVIAEIEYQRT